MILSSVAKRMCSHVVPLLTQYVKDQDFSIKARIISREAFVELLHKCAFLNKIRKNNLPEKFQGVWNHSKIGGPLCDNQFSLKFFVEKIKRAKIDLKNGGGFYTYERQHLGRA